MATVYRPQVRRERAVYTGRMAPLARILRLLSLAVWLGGLVFFGAVVAPHAAHLLMGMPQFAPMVGGSLLTLHAMGLWCGVGIILAVRLLGRRARLPYVQIVLAVLMMVLTFCSTRFIILPMEHDRALAGGNIQVLLAGSPLREDFDRRHAWSTRVEGTVMLLGIGLAVLIGMEDTMPEPRGSGYRPTRRYVSDED